MCLVYAFSALLFWLTIRYLGERWWPATVLLYAPRWPWLLPIAILAPLCARRPKLLAPLTLTALFVLIPLMGFTLPWRRMFSPQPSGEKIRVLVCNVHSYELNRAALEAYIQQTQPQVLLLQDYSGLGKNSSIRRPMWNTYQLGQLFIASRFPIAQVHDLQLERLPGEETNDIDHPVGTASCFDLQTPDGIVHAINLHLASPHAGLREFRHNAGEAIDSLESNSRRRWSESKRIDQWLASQSGPLVIAGDFNMPADGPIYRYFWSKYSDAFPTAGIGFGYTHFSSLSELRIDHLLMGPGVVCDKYEIGPPCGTPHRPVVADLVIGN